MRAESGLEFAAEAELPGFALAARFTVAPGETLALVGPSGAGKSTCLAIIAGLARPRCGLVRLGAETLLDTDHGIDLAPWRRGLGMSPQDLALFPHLTVAGNVLYGARLRHADRSRAQAAARTWLERLGLAALSQRSVDALSGGERQRVALARALAAAPRALLLDEPLAALDSVTRAGARSALRRHLAEARLPTVLVCHDPLDALLVADRVAVMEQGRITQEGNARALALEPRSAFVAEFAGVNLVAAELAAGTGLKVAQAGGVAFHVVADDLAGAVYLAFAPSAVVLSAAAPSGSARNVYPAVVAQVLRLGDRERVLLDAGFSLAAEVTREAAEALALRPGQKVWCAVKATAMRVYP